MTRKQKSDEKGDLDQSVSDCRTGHDCCLDIYYNYHTRWCNLPPVLQYSRFGALIQADTIWSKGYFLATVSSKGRRQVLALESVHFKLWYKYRCQ